MEKVKIVQYGKTIDVVKGELKLRKTFEDKESRELIKGIGSEIKVYQEKEKLSKKEEVLLKKLETELFNKMQNVVLQKEEEKVKTEIAKKSIEKRIVKNSIKITKLNSKQSIDDLLKQNKDQELEIAELKKKLEIQKENTKKADVAPTRRSGER